MSGIKRRRNAYDAGFKLKVVAYAAENGNANAERYFNVDEMNIRRCRSMKDVLAKMPKSKRLEEVRLLLFQH